MNCLSEVYSFKGLLQEVDGVAVNKPEIFCVEENADPDIIRMYADLASRIGTEITGMRLPIMGKKAKDAVTIKIDAAVEENLFLLSIYEEGLCISAKTKQMLFRAVEYLTVMYPYFGNDCCFAAQKEALNGADITAAVFDGETFDIKQLKSEGIWSS